MEEYGLVESPSIYRDLTLRHDDWFMNSAEALKVETQGELLGIYKAGGLKFRLYQIKEGDTIFIDLLEEKFPTVCVMHSFSEIKLENLNGIENHSIWNSRAMRGMARYWIFDYISKKYDFMISDKTHTPKGKIYWESLIVEAIDKKMKVGVIDIKNNNQFEELNNTKELEQYCGDDKGKYRLIIFFEK